MTKAARTKKSSMRLAVAAWLSTFALTACSSLPVFMSGSDDPRVVSQPVLSDEMAANLWVGAWASSQQIPEPRNALPDEDFTDVTMRQTVRVTRGGDVLRLRISNLHGTAPLKFEHVQIAKAEAAGSDRIMPGTGRTLTFSGQQSVIVPQGAEYLSDPVPFDLNAFDDVAISFYIENPPAQQTSHPGSRTTSHYVHGDHVTAEALPDSAGSIDHWYQISGIDVMAPAGAASISVIGDSITDGRGSTTNGNDRWPDLLAKRLQANESTQHVSVLNHGIGGGRVLNYGLGPAALARFDRDVLTQTGVKYLIILEGVNDIGTFMGQGNRTAAEHEELVHRMISTYEQMIARAHERGIKVYGATIMPYAGFDYYPSDALSERSRKAINNWIRNSGRFDAVLDFDKVIRDPANRERMLPAYDTGDHIHPSVAGFQAMADSIPLELFEK